jgi:hypothetical protein
MRRDGAPDGKGEVMTNRTAEAALSNLGGTMPDPLPGDYVGPAGQVIQGVVSGNQRARIQRGIDDCMRGAIEDAMRRPNPVTAGPNPDTRRPQAQVRPVAPRGTGWREGAPLHTHADQSTNAYIDGLALAMQPHGPANAAQPKRREKNEGGS